MNTFCTTSPDSSILTYRLYAPRAKANFRVVFDKTREPHTYMSYGIYQFTQRRIEDAVLLFPPFNKLLDEFDRIAI